MAKEIPFGEFIHELTIHQYNVSYNQLVPAVEYDDKGQKVPHKPRKIKLKTIEVYRVLEQYLSVRILEQIKAVVPLALYLALFQTLVLRQQIVDSLVITGGLLAVIIGLMFFMEGLKQGLMPFGRSLGVVLPQKSTLSLVLFITFLLGIGVTVAEPAIGALKTAGQIVDVEKAPYLYTLLNDYSGLLLVFVGIGVGIAAVIGTTRFIYGWQLKHLIYITLIPTISLTAYLASLPELSKILALAWDCGAVTTGPVTVPLVLSLGIGIATSAGKNNSTLSGFGIVTLASLFPIIAVMSFGLALSFYVTPENIIQAHLQNANHQVALAWYQVTPVTEILAGIRAIVPLVLFLLGVMYFVLNEKLGHPKRKAYGIFLAVTGMIIFNLGLTYGLAKLGSQSGGILPGAFMNVEAVQDSPFFTFTFGISVTILFALVLGFGATLAEPALNALGITVQELTNGALKKTTLMYAVSFGVSVGIALGVTKIIFDIPLIALILPAYTLGVILTFLSTDEFVNIAWDSAGVTTGPITVPLVLSMGLGLGNAVGSTEGFGILSMASIGPIVAVLSVGLYIRWQKYKKHKAIDSKLLATEGGSI